MTRHGVRPLIVRQQSTSQHLSRKVRNIYQCPSQHRFQSIIHIFSEAGTMTPRSLLAHGSARGACSGLPWHAMLQGSRVQSRSRPAPLQCRQASGTSTSSRSAGSTAQTPSYDTSRQQMAQRAEQLPALLQEIGETVIANGPRGAIRRVLSSSCYYLQI